MGKNKEWAPFSLWCKFTSFLHKLQLYLPHFQDTRGVMSLQHVLVTYHSVCRGQEISCLNKWHDSCVTNCFVWSGEFLWKSLSQQQNFTATNRTNSVWFDFVRLVAATKFCWGDKDFHKNSPVQTKKIVSAMCWSNVLLQLVCFNIKSTHLRFWQIQSHRVL